MCWFVLILSAAILFLFVMQYHQYLPFRDFVLTVAWNVFSHISWHYAINCLKMQGGIFFPLHRCSSTWGCCGFRSPFHPFRCWSSVLEVCPVGVKEALVAKPARGVSAAAPRALLWQGRGSTRNSPCKPSCSGPCCGNPPGCVTPAGLHLWLKVTHLSTKCL